MALAPDVARGGAPAGPAHVAVTPGAREGLDRGEVARRAVALTLPFLAWELAARLAGNRLLPGPVEVGATLLRLIGDGTIWFHGSLTLQRGAVGLAIAVLAGLGLGVLLARVRWAEAAFQPLLAATYPVPKIALFPLVILVLGFGAASKIFMVALECVYPIAYNTYAGIQGVDRNYLWVARNAEAGLAARVGILVRGALPPIMAALRMAVPIMLVIMVVTELIGESRGLGFLIRQAGTDFAPAEGLAVILLLGVLGFVLDRLVVWLSGRLAFWARGVAL